MYRACFFLRSQKGSIRFNLSRGSHLTRRSQDYHLAKMAECQGCGDVVVLVSCLDGCLELLILFGTNGCELLHEKVSEPMLNRS